MVNDDIRLAVVKNMSSSPDFCCQFNIFVIVFLDVAVFISPINLSSISYLLVFVLHIKYKEKVRIAKTQTVIIQRRRLKNYSHINVIIVHLFFSITMNIVCVIIVSLFSLIIGHFHKREFNTFSTSSNSF